MGADKLAKKYPKCPKMYLPKFPAQAQKFGVSMKKASLGVRSPCNITKFVNEIGFPERGSRKLINKEKLIRFLSVVRSLNPSK